MPTMSVNRVYRWHWRDGEGLQTDRAQRADFVAERIPGARWTQVVHGKLLRVAARIPVFKTTGMTAEDAVDGSAVPERIARFFEAFAERSDRRPVDWSKGPLTLDLAAIEPGLFWWRRQDPSDPTFLLITFTMLNAGHAAADYEGLDAVNRIRRFATAYLAGYLDGVQDAAQRPPPQPPS